MTKKIIPYNIKVHNKISKKYEESHGDIYNDIEQKRLRNSLAESIAYINTSSKRKEAFDFGAGAGNLTKHMLELNLDVCAGDVSDNFLDLIISKFKEKYRGHISTIKINGENLHNINTYSFDFVASYSVLHHVPKYLELVEEFCRILKPGGVLYIDHENSSDFWKQNSHYKDYLKDLKKIRKSVSRFFHLFIPTYWIYLFKSFVNPRFRIEGDIHVFPDDHIEWGKIRSILIKNNFEILKEHSYLLYRKGFPINLYNKYKNTCNDVCLIVARKIK